jgi:hypothetical protein
MESHDTFNSWNDFGDAVSVIAAFGWAAVRFTSKQASSRSSMCHPCGRNFAKGARNGPTRCGSHEEESTDD